MKRMLALTFTIFFAVMMVFSTGGRQAMTTGPGCIVHPDVIQSCEESGGRFDWGLCSCVGGSATASTVAE